MVVFNTSKLHVACPSVSYLCNTLALTVPSRLRAWIEHLPRGIGLFCAKKINDPLLTAVFLGEVRFACGYSGPFHRSTSRNHTICLVASSV
ncbi:uncharacterized protein BDV17DRAFT_242142 [Aspergillus undulatus]|uniref:uncharacterized protein n=1 Tax=Aspergillus undulatus TaxID=1810928 RepID=UPI003CCE5135